MDGNISSFKELMEKINSFTTDEEIEEFVRKRIDYLEFNSQKRKISNFSKEKLGMATGSINDGYITMDSEIVSSLLVDPFYIDDINIYTNFIKYIKGKDLSNVLYIFYQLTDFTEGLFGFNKDQNLRETIYLKKQMSGEKVSIKDFYHNDSALCSERSAVVQNLAEFCGIKSYMMFGKLINEEGNKEEDHAYNIFEASDGTLILYDVTNPVNLNIDGEIRHAPAFSIIGKEDINNLEEIDFDLDFIARINRGELHEVEKTRKYVTSNYIKKQLDSTNTK